jgi:methyl-accepting chemotaxis protein
MLNKFKVATRIYAGFCVIVACGVLLAAFGVFQLSHVAQQVARMDSLADDMSRVLGASETLETIRRVETSVRRDATAAALTELKVRVAQTGDLISDAADGSESGERRAILSGIKDSLQAHAAVVDQLAKLAVTRNAARGKLYSGGEALSDASAKLVQAAGSMASAVAAENLNAATLAVRVANWRFVATLEPKGPDAFAAKVAAARASLASFAGQAGPPEQSAIGPVKSALDDYQQAFQTYASAQTASIDLYDAKLQPGIIDMQARLGRAKTSLQQSFAAAIAQSDQILSSTSRLQEVLAGVSLLAGAGLAFFIGRGIARPIRTMTGAMSKLAQGDTEIIVPARANTDEIGEMARAVEVFRQQAIENTRLSADAARQQVAKDRRQKSMDRHTEDFGNSIAGVMASLSTAASAMQQSASAVTENAQRTRVTTSGTAENARDSARDLNAVAAATEQLAHSVSEISRQVAHVTVSVRTAVNHAAQTDAKVTGLSEAADRIGDVVRLITTVASQTNLLALNATIEAARAGEAGRGFAVVAGEVKALATQTADATNQIAGQIVAIRNATAEAVSAVRDVGSAISQVESVATAIAAAVEQQAAATREITDSVQKVNQSTSAAVHAMDEVLAIAESTDASSQTALGVAEEVGRTATTLRQEVTEFLAAMSRGDDEERRRYERIHGGGAMAMFRRPGHPPTQVRIEDISRGGVALQDAGTEEVGASVEVELPGGGCVQGRVARVTANIIAISLRQDDDSLAAIDRALALIKYGRTARAA